LVGTQAFHTCVYHVAHDAVGEAQIVIFPTLSLIVMLQSVPIGVTVHIPPATAIQLSPSVLPVKVNCNIQLKIPSLGVQVPHTGAVVSIFVILYPVLVILPVLSRTIPVHEALPVKIMLSPDCRVAPLSKLY
jgi:hypothetical protein